MSNGDNTVGEMLRKAREAKKLTVEQVHRETKISPEVIESLEQDDYGSFASETYLKGFLKNYASFLGLEPNALWAMISRKSAPTESGATYWDTEESVREEHLSSPRIFRRFVLPVMILVIILLAVLLVREHRKVQSLTSGVSVRDASGEVMAVAADL